MSPTPWDVLASAVTRLSDKVSAVPEIREATVASMSPLQVLFDTDVFPTVVKGNLAGTLLLGERVLTVKLRHYVWILGARQGVGGHKTDDWNKAISPGFYWSEQAALNNPVGNIAVGFVMAKPEGINPRIMQIVYFPSETASARRREYRRVLNVGTGVWSTWAEMNFDTGWLSSGVFAAMSGWTLVSQSARIQDNTAIIRYLEVTRSTALNGPAGDIGNSGIVTMADSRFTPLQNMGGLSAAATGRTLAATASATGQIVLTAVGAGLTDNTGIVPAGSSWSVSGFYLLD